MAIFKWSDEMRRNSSFYINTVVSEIYRDLKTGTDGFFSPYADALYRYSSSCDCLTNDIGSSYAYYSLRDSSGMPIAFFSKTALKRKAVSVCKYTQCIAWETDDNVFKENFTSVFNTGFLTEDEVDAFAAGDRSTLLGNGGDNLLAADPSLVEINKDALRAITYKVMMRWLMGDEQVKIGVPAGERKNYNSYVLRAVNEIYSYFPYAMRCEAGFSSYLDSKKFKEMKRIYMVFVPEEEADSETLFLDGSTPSIYRKILDSNSLLPQLKSFLDHICNCSDPGDFLQCAYDDIEGANNRKLNVSPIKYKDLGRAVAILDDTRPEPDQIPDWVDFAHNGFKDLKGMQTLVEKKIGDELTKQGLTEYTQSRLNGFSALSDKLNSAEYIKPVTVFSDDSKGLSLVPWNCIKACIDSYETSEEEKYSFIDKNIGRLKQLSGNNEPTELQNEYAKECAEIIGKAAEQEIAGLKSAGQSLHEYRSAAGALIEKAIDKISRYLPDLETNAFRTALMENAYEYIVSVVKKNKDAIDTDVKDQEQFRECIEELEKCRAELEPVLAETSGYKKLSDEFDSDIRKLREKMDSSGIVLQKLKKSIDEFGNYFAAIELCHETASRLSETDVIEANRYALQFKPASLEDYENAFSSHYGKPLTSAGLRAASSKVLPQIEADLQNIYSTQVFPIIGKNPESMLKSIRAISSKAEQLAPNTKARFSLFGTNVSDVELIENVLLFGVKKGANEENVYSIVSSLASESVFTGTHIFRLREMFEECGFKQERLLSLVAGGGFASTEEKDYARFFREMLHYVEERSSVGGKKSREEAYKYLQKNVSSWDETAKKAFEKLKPEEKAPAAESNKPAPAPASKTRVEYVEVESKGKKAAILVLSLLLLASVAFNVLQAFGILKFGAGKEALSIAQQVSNLMIDAVSTDFENASADNAQNIKDKIVSLNAMYDNALMNGGVKSSARRGFKVVSLLLDSELEPEKSFIKAKELFGGIKDGSATDISIADAAKEAEIRFVEAALDSVEELKTEYSEELVDKTVEKISLAMDYESALERSTEDFETCIENIRQYNQLTITAIAEEMQALEEAERMDEEVASEQTAEPVDAASEIDNGGIETAEDADTVESTEPPVEETPDCRERAEEALLAAEAFLRSLLPE